MAYSNDYPYRRAYFRSYRELEATIMKRLTEEAQNDRDAYERLDSRYGCSCHISPPCGTCTHPGNPQNQDDEAFWEECPDEGE
jgi:hypothetical protein